MRERWEMADGSCCGSLDVEALPAAGGSVRRKMSADGTNPRLCKVPSCDASNAVDGGTSTEEVKDEVVKCYG